MGNSHNELLGYLREVIARIDGIDDTDWQSHLSHVIPWMLVECISEASGRLGVECPLRLLEQTPGRRQLEFHDPYGTGAGLFYDLHVDGQLVEKRKLSSNDRVLIRNAMESWIRYIDVGLNHLPEHIDRQGSDTSSPTKPDLKGIPSNLDQDCWILGKNMAEILGVKTKTLANHRNEGDKSDDGMKGHHDGHLVWRKPNKNSDPRYYAPLVKSHVGQLAKTFPEIDRDCVKNLPANRPRDD